MPLGCWIDLYETANCSGHRRRFFGPAMLDAVVWRQFAVNDHVCISVGPRARARIDAADGRQSLVEPGETSSHLHPQRVALLAIELAAPSAPRRMQVHRSVDDAPPSPRPRCNCIGSSDEREAEPQAP